MRFLYVREEQLAAKTVTFDDEQVHRLRKVLRMQAGDQLLLRSRTTGRPVSVVIRRLDKRTGFAEQSQAAVPELRAPQCRLHLAAALLKQRRLELVFQKCTELGVATLHPLVTTNVVARDLSSNEFRRLGDITEEACQQCGRPLPPTIAAVTEFEQFVSEWPARQVTTVLLHEGPRAATLSRSEFDDWAVSEVAVLVGPEGGFSEAEVVAAVAAGVHVRRLSGYVLRAETAAITIAALLTAGR